MLRKFVVAGLLAGAALGFAAAPAAADGHTFNQNVQVITLQQCNSSINVVGVPVNLLSNQPIDQCVNGPQQTVTESESEKSESTPEKPKGGSETEEQAGSEKETDKPSGY
ncbi:hypothetical protein ACQEU5_06050 [Marinactinospora thermotolerans]|uniref:Small secreted domain n=1 Tax=Marinactinospora thermotolerans DSM 45154 TaxID=1122192 RepID=A0A1T4STP2_9ACTN|nr:hypothetical protein [Marinactinospora thermotolerans]SKA31526.1 hypothetical protein SAMN02745673_03976 [Marinactinospora thermotolerans DSM 45154]